jgi:hypothetical protein
MHDESSSEDHTHAAGHVVRAHRPESALRAELVTHLPFSVGSVAAGLVVAGIICFLSPATEGLPPGRSDIVSEPAGSGEEPAHVHDPFEETEHEHDHAAEDPHDHGESPADARAHDHDHDSGFRPLFHLFHPLHMFFSAAATTAMFWRYDKKLVKALLVGMIGAVGVCGISDIAMPHASLLLLGKHLPWHVCVLEHPGMVLPFAAVGVVVGLLAAVGVARSTIFSHSIHVSVSTMASIFYMIQGYGRLAWIDDLGWIFCFIILAVMVPCCLSDIVFPLAMSRTARKAYAQEACCH